MTLLNSQYHIDYYLQKSIPEADLKPLVRSRLLQSATKGLAEREDLFESEHHLGESGVPFKYTSIIYKLKLYVFSEAELIDYRNSIIVEFMGATGVFRAVHPQQQENN